jgi:hypothetical protein
VNACNDEVFSLLFTFAGAVKLSVYAPGKQKWDRIGGALFAKENEPYIRQDSVFIYNRFQQLDINKVKFIEQRQPLTNQDGIETWEHIVEVQLRAKSLKKLKSLESKKLR